MIVNQVLLPYPRGCTVENRIDFLGWMDEMLTSFAVEVGFHGDIAADFREGFYFLNLLTYPDERRALILTAEDLELIHEALKSDIEHLETNQEPAVEGGVPGGWDGTLDCISPD